MAHAFGAVQLVFARSVDTVWIPSVVRLERSVSDVDLFQQKAAYGSHLNLSRRIPSLGAILID